MLQAHNSACKCADHIDHHAHNACDHCNVLQEYIRQLGACFAMLAKGLQPDDPQSPVLMQLQQWAIECALLLIATAFSSPKALRNLYHCNFADGAITDKDLPQHFYQGLVVSLLDARG